MLKRISKIILILTMFIFVLIFFQNACYADGINTNEYSTSLSYSEASDIFNRGGKVLKILRNIAAVVSIVTITIIGLRYMVGSVEQKAEYKQTMVPVMVGCILVASLSGILTLIQSVL